MTVRCLRCHDPIEPGDNCQHCGLCYGCIDDDLGRHAYGCQEQEVEI